MGYSFRLAARVLLYASSHRQDNTYHGLCYTSRGAQAGTRNSSMGPLQHITGKHFILHIIYAPSNGPYTMYVYPKNGLERYPVINHVIKSN